MPVLIYSQLITPPAVQAFNNVSDSASVTVTITATVGESKLTLYGYTSPWAKVLLEGIGVGRETKADETGYFLFDRVFLPDPTSKWISPLKTDLAYPELYLISVDTQAHASSPVQLPQIPLGNYEIVVGPVLMSPTLVLEKGQYLPNEQIVASGQTIPKTQVSIFLANNIKEEKGWFKRVEQWFLKALTLNPSIYIIPPQTFAYKIPNYQVLSNEKGEFQFNLPKGTPASWHIFANTSYLESPSPKSNTLNFRVLNALEWLLGRLTGILLGLWLFLKPYWWILVISLQVILIGTLGFTLIYRRRINTDHRSHTLITPHSSV